MKYIGKAGEYFELDHIISSNCYKLKEQTKNTLRLFWFTSANNQLIIDKKPYTFNENEIVFLTEFPEVEIVKVYAMNLLRFNKSFYCILDHDSEVGCKGILYYGAGNLPVVVPYDMELDILKTAWKMADLEFEMKDDLQLEMLQMMLKRILILCTRIYKNQSELKHLTSQQNNLVRNYNYLVESNFKTLHTVAGYAKLLHKSPKTISNVFKKLGAKSPLQFIQDRLLLEAIRELTYTGRGISDIAYELGFNDVQAFSRFFKKKEGMSPTFYRNHLQREKLPMTQE